MKEKKIKIKEHDIVCVTENFAGDKVPKGTEGTVVSVYRNGKAYAVEFLNGLVLTVYPKEMRLKKSI